MARIRTIKPEFWTDGAIIECSTNARLLFIGLWNFADDNGNLEGGPKTIKALILPADDINVTPLLAELTKHELIIFYKVKEKVYLNIRRFKDHQRIDRPGKPRCPFYDPSANGERMVVEPSSPEGKGREGKGKDLKPLEHPEPDAPNSRTNFEDIWDWYPEKKGKEKAWVKFKNQVLTVKDLDNINVALGNYIADIEQIRLNGHPDRAWQHGSTWFNENWKDFVDYQPPPVPVKIVNGLPLPDEEPRPHNELVNLIVEQMAFCEEHLADTEWEGAVPDLNWLNMTVGHLILEYSERFPKGPHIDKYSAWLDHQTEIVMTAEDST